MAELAMGAVGTLLGVIGNEALRLGRVQVDVQFIKEEMESISSFLANLAGAGREHDEQVRTWMNQARILANDCNRCIDLYLYRGDPGLNLPSEGLCRYLGWAPWLLRKLYAQHRAAGQLSDLKERARNIGERRLRYGVEVKTPDRPSSSTKQPLSLTTEDHEEEQDDHDNQDKRAPICTTYMCMDDEKYLKEKLNQWIRPVVQDATRSIPSVVILLPKTKDAKVADTLVSHARVVANTHLKNAVLQKKTQIEWNIVIVDVPKMNPFIRLYEWDILFYILYQLKLSQGQQQREGITPPTTNPIDKWDLFMQNQDIIEEIYDKRCMEINLDTKFEEITTAICSQVGSKKDDDFNDKKIPEKSLDQLLRRLIVQSTTATPSKEDQEKFPRSYQKIIKETAKKLKEKIHGGSNQQIQGGSDQQQIQGSSNKQIDGVSDKQKDVVSDQQTPDYEDILEEVFPKPTTVEATNANTTSTNTPVEDQIIEIIDGVKEMLRDLKELYNFSGGVKSEDAAHGPEADFGKSREDKIFLDKTKEKIREIKFKIVTQLLIRGIVDKNQEELGDNNKRILVILKTGNNKHVSVWEETKKTLNRVGCSTIAGAMILATKTTQHQNKEDFCYPRLKLIEYPLVGRYLKTILKSTKPPVPKEDSRRMLLRNILYECETDEFSMNIFAHTFHAKPKRSSEELRKLLDTLQAKQNSSPDIATKMLNFSYKDLPKEYRSCLLYLAIFPAKTEIRLSSLVGRWVAEGLITTTDWSWSSSVGEALKCSEALIARGLLSPVAIGATGKVKSCRVNKSVHGFIAKIARKQRILETRLPSHLARHFSIFSDVRLRISQKVEDFLKNMPKSSQFSKIKVLDLEECNCFKGNRQYLRDICSKILMLRYLSLRNTDADHLPRAINNLHELEVLDIRETQIPKHATRKILLWKLKRVLGGSSHTEFSSYHIPEKIDKMEGMEVLSNVEPLNHRDLDHIAGRFMLNKLGVVIKKESHLKALLKATKDLKMSLQSLTITLNMLTPPTDECFKDKDLDRKSIGNTPQWNPEGSVLESLSIMGSAQKKELLKWFSENTIKVAKVSISGSFRQDDMNILAKFPSLICVRLRHIKYTGYELVFNAVQDGFNTFIVEETDITKIRFEDVAASKSMKMVGLKELDQDGVAVPENVEQDINKNGDQSAARTDGATARCPSLWKAKSWLRRN